MRLVPRFLRPTRWLRLTSKKPDPDNPDFTVGEIRSFRWMIWHNSYFPYRTYPLMPFKKEVYWHWRGRVYVLPRPWGKDPFEGFDEDD